VRKAETTARHRARVAGQIFVCMAIIIILFGQTQASSPSSQGQHSRKLDDVLQNMADRSGIVDGSVPVIIEFIDQPGGGMSHEARDNMVHGSGGAVRKHYDGLAATAAQLDRSRLNQLAGDPLVKHISYDHPVKSTLATTVRAIGADQVWAKTKGVNGITGKGVTIAVIDSGIIRNVDLPNLVKDGFSFNAEAPADFYGHGTHVAGIIDGSGAASSSLPEHYIGVAPDSSVINLKVLDRTGVGYTSSVIAADRKSVV